jgi:hypothetical protein
MTEHGNLPAKRGRRDNFPKHEKRKHLFAFERYCQMGLGRSLRKLAQELGVHISTISCWSSAFKWQERVREYDKQLSREILERIKAQAVQERLKTLRRLDLILNKAYKSFLVDHPEKSEALTPLELAKLEELKLKLMGVGADEETTLTKEERETTPEVALMIAEDYAKMLRSIIAAKERERKPLESPPIEIQSRSVPDFDVNKALGFTKVEIAEMGKAEHELEHLLDEEEREAQ